MTAVASVDLNVHAGEVVLIMGPSGSGKTTPLPRLGAMLRPSAGRQVARLLRQLATEDYRAVVIVSHDIRLQEIADPVLWLKDGSFR